MQASQLKFFSTGFVAQNKALKSNDVEVFPSEAAPMTDGQVTGNADTFKTTGQDQTGAAFNVTMKATSTLNCTWLPLGSSNRKTSPDVRRGEEVMIMQFADADKYYWVTMKDGSALRKLETVVYAFSGTQDESAGSDADTCYYFEVSTHKKLIHLHTSQANGEQWGFDIQINTDGGFIQFQDTVGNTFTLDASENQLTMQNANGSIVDVNKTNITISCSDTMTLKATTINQQSTTSNIKTTTSNIQASQANMTGSSGVQIESPNTNID